MSSSRLREAVRELQARIEMLEERLENPGEDEAEELEYGELLGGSAIDEVRSRARVWEAFN